MNTNTQSPIDAKYVSYAATTTYRTLTNGVWINPHPSKAKTPVADGGLVLSNFTGKTSLPKFEITYPSTGKTEMVHGAKEVLILPIFLTAQYSVVSYNEEVINVKRPIYVKQTEWPQNMKIASAATLFFVLVEDDENNLCQITFKSHLASSIEAQFNRRRRAVAATGRRLVGVNLEIFALPAKIVAGAPRAVGQKQVGYIADPIITGEEYETVEDLDKALIDPVRFAELSDIARDQEVVTYPFNRFGKRQFYETYEEAIRILSPGSQIKAPAPALPKKSDPTVQIIDARDASFPF